MVHGFLSRDFGLEAMFISFLFAIIPPNNLFTAVSTSCRDPMLLKSKCGNALLFVVLFLRNSLQDFFQKWHSNLNLTSQWTFTIRHWYPYERLGKTTQKFWIPENQRFFMIWYKPLRARCCSFCCEGHSDSIQWPGVHSPNIQQVMGSQEG